VGAALDGGGACGFGGPGAMGTTPGLVAADADAPAEMAVDALVAEDVPLTEPVVDFGDSDPFASALADVGVVASGV